MQKSSLPEGVFFSGLAKRLILCTIKSDSLKFYLGISAT